MFSPLLAASVDAGRPVDDAVGARVDRRTRDRERWKVLLRGAQLGGRLDMAVAQLVVQRRRVRPVGRSHPERAAQRDHEANLVRHRPRQRSGVDPAEAPAHQRDRSLVAVVQLLQPLLHPLHGGCGRPEVTAEPPAVRPVPLTAEDVTQRARAGVGGGESGEHEYGVTIAATEHPQPRRGGDERTELEDGALLQRDEVPRRLPERRRHVTERTRTGTYDAERQETLKVHARAPMNPPRPSGHRRDPRRATC